MDEHKQFVCAMGVVCVFGVWGIVFGVWGLVFGVWGLVCGVWCLVCGVWCLVFWGCKRNYDVVRPRGLRFYKSPEQGLNLSGS